MAGEQVDKGKCLFINPEIKNLEDILADMSQAEYRDDTGKNQGRQAASRPLANRCRQAPTPLTRCAWHFSYDCRHGLRATGRPKPSVLE